MGVRLTHHVLESLRGKVRNTRNKDEVIKNLEKEILENFVPAGRTLNSSATPPSIILLLGVNGVGKTLTTGKLAFKLKNEGKKIILAASDTFRAAAIEELGILSNRIGVELI